MSSSINPHPVPTVDQVASAGLEASASRSKNNRTRQADDRSRRHRNPPQPGTEEPQPAAEGSHDDGLGMNVNMEV